MRRHPPAMIGAVLAAVLVASASRAEEEPVGTRRARPPEETKPGSLGISPEAPQVPTLPGGVTPAFETQPTRPQDWALAFHGFLSMPLRLGISERPNPGPGQSATVLHAPPRVPGDFESFDYTAVVPNPWVQLNFSYQHKFVTATVIVAGRTASNASGYFNPPDLVGINDAFLTFRAPVGERLRLTLNAGAFANHYGNMGELDLGRYGTPLIGRVAGTGATGTAAWEFGDLQLLAEAGFQGQFKKAPVGVEPAGWNGFADPNVGTTWAPHAHAVAGYKKRVQLGGHFLKAFARDDRATVQSLPDGSISVLGTDVRLSLSRFGHAYAGFASTDARSARSVSDVLRVLNAPGGKGLMEEYFDPAGDGTGTLRTFGAQYDFSLGNFLRHPSAFEGQAPDVVASVFAILTRAQTEAARADKAKYGFELGYGMLSWLAVAGRYDRVLPDLDDPTQTHAIATARVILHSDWGSRDQVVLQYSRWFNGSGSVVKDGYPPVKNPAIVPDAHAVSLLASMWW